MFNDIDYDAVFGLDAEAEDASGEKNQEAADPDAEEDAEGEEEQEAAEPADEEDAEDEISDESDDTADDEQPDTEETDETSGRSGERKPKGKKDSVFAAARRKAEAEAEEKANKRIDDMIKGFGWKNPYDGDKPITSAAEYEEYRKAYAEDQRRNMAKKAGMSEEEFNGYISELPEVRQAKALQQQALQERVQAQIAAELKEISALNPAVREMADVLSGESGETVKAYISRGYNLVDAYKLVHFSELQSDAAEGRRKAAEVNAAGKSHLTQSKSRGQGMAAVPQDTKETYRIFFPDMSDSDIQKEYARWEKK